MDVLACVELLRCRWEGLAVRKATSDKPRRLVEASEEEREGTAEAYRMVLEGLSPRRWLPAMQGRIKTAGQANAPTDYEGLLRRAIISMETCFEAWEEEISEPIKGAALRQLKKLFAEAPPEVRVAVRRVVGGEV